MNRGEALAAVSEILIENVATLTCTGTPVEYWLELLEETERWAHIVLALRFAERSILVEQAR